MRQTSFRSVGPGRLSERPGPPENPSRAKIYVLPVPCSNNSRPKPASTLLTRLVTHLRDLAGDGGEPGQRIPAPGSNVVEFPRMGQYRHPSRWRGPNGGAA
jgi:hypothetical protein